MIDSRPLIPGTSPVGIAFLAVRAGGRTQGFRVLWPPGSEVVAAGRARALGVATRLHPRSCSCVARPRGGPRPTRGGSVSNLMVRPAE